MDGIPLENRWAEMGSDSSHLLVTHICFSNTGNYTKQLPRS